MIKEPRLRFTEEERADPALEKPIRKAEKAAAKADKAQAKIPKKQVKRAEVDPKTGKVTTKLVLEDKPRPPSKLSHTVRDAPGNAVRVSSIRRSARPRTITWAWRAPTSPRSRRDRRASGPGGLPQPQTETLPQGRPGRAEAGKGQHRGAVQNPSMKTCGSQ